MAEKEKTLVEQRREQIFEFMNTLDPDVNARVLAKFLMRQAKIDHAEDPETAEYLINIFKSRIFLKNLTKKISAIGVDGVIDEMAELDANSDPKYIYKFLTGEEYVEPADEQNDDYDDYDTVDVVIDA